MKKSLIILLLNLFSFCAFAQNGTTIQYKDGPECNSTQYTFDWFETVGGKQHYRVSDPNYTDFVYIKYNTGSARWEIIVEGEVIFFKAGSTSNPPPTSSGSWNRTASAPCSLIELSGTGTASAGNTAPTDISLTSTAVNENVSANTTVGTLSATDTEGGGMTYTLVSGTGSTDNASFGITGTSLTILSSPDYEVKSSYSIRIRVTDGGSLFYEKQFTITVNNLNDAPTLSGGPYSFTGINTSSTSTGVLVSTILAGVTYADQDAGSQSGIAVSGSSGSGTWEYSTDNTNWTGLGTVSGSAALLLSTATYVRYTATANGETASLTFRAWDRTSGTASTNGTRRTADVSTNGGATAYSSGTATANMVVAALATQTITFNALSGVTYGVADIDPGATASSGLTVSYQSSNTAVATIVAGKIHVTGAGTSTITASQAGNGSFQAAADKTQDIVVAKKDITLSLSATPAITKVYDGLLTATLASSNYSITGLVGSDAVSVSGSATYDTKTAGVGKTVTVNSFVLSGAQKDNYNVTTTTATVTGAVTAKAITATINATPTIAKPYDGLTTATLVASNYTLTGVEAGDVVSVSGTAAYTTSSVGTGKTINVTALTLSGAQKDNYSLLTSSATTTGMITTLAITVTASSLTKTYGDTDPSLTYSFSPALVTGDVFSGALTRTTGESAGTHTIQQGTLSLSSNYTLSFVPANLTISKKTINVTADAKNKTYGDAEPLLTYVSSPVLVSGDVFTGSLTRTAGESAGTYTIQQGTLSLTSNYALNYTPADLTIGKKTITVIADAKSKTYGDTDPTFTYVSTPVLITGDVFTGSLTRTASEIAGTHTILQGTLSLTANYTINYTSAQLTISKKTINVTADVKTKTYGDSDPALSYAFTPALVSGDVFSGALSRTAGEHVGTYAVNKGSLTLPSNYTLSYAPANLTINKKTINVSADAKTKVYGEADPAFTYSFNPSLVTGDAFTGTLTRVSGELPGTYQVNQGSLALTDDYTLTFTPANFTVTPSTSADLSALAPSSGALTPAFAASTITYSVTVANTVSTITLTATPALSVASVKVNGNAVSNANPSVNLPLTLGNNRVTIVVTAQDGTTTKTYLLDVIRNPVSGNADLSALAVAPGSLSPSFASAALTYTVSIDADVSTVNFTPTAADAGAVIKANGTVVASGSNSAVTTDSDVTTLTLDVVAQDGVTKKVYTVSFVKPVTTWTGATGDAWTSAANWTNGIPDVSKLTVIADVLPRPVVSASQTIAGLVVKPGAAARLAGNLLVTGNMVNNGTISGTGLLVFNGNTAQQISGQGAVHHLTNLNVTGLDVQAGAGNTLNITGILTISAGTLNTADNLVLKSSASATASVAALPVGASIAGLVTVERWMEAQRGYRAFGHPFSHAVSLSQLTDDFSISGSGTGFVTGLGYSTASVSYYDSAATLATAFKKPLSNAPNTSSLPLWSQGRGILALVRGKGNEGLGGTYPSVNQPSAFAANATGTLTQGNATYQLGANSIGSSFNLVGNPYAAPINIKLLKSNGGVSLAANNGTSGVASTIYVYNPFKNAGTSTTPSQEVRGGLDAYTNDGITDIIIPAFGAFFVQSKAAGNIISFTENVKTTAAVPLAVMGGGSGARLTLSVENSRGSWDEIKLRWDKAAGAGGSDAYDGVKLSNELLDAYSIAADSKLLCIDSRSDSFGKEEIIPLGIKTNVQDATFRLRVSNYHLPANVQVVLYDKFLGTVTQLGAVDDAYPFAITSDSLTKGNERFQLGIGFKKKVSTTENADEYVRILPNPFREELQIQLGTRARSQQATRVRLIDVHGRTIRSVIAAPDASTIRLWAGDISAGIYFVELLNDVVRVTKQVIRQ